ncbi:MAG: thymidine phosphorylase [bacterium]|nr:thymidine phosphorylase [bacterium]
MDPLIFRILERKRFGETLTSEEIHALVTGAANGTWGDAELGAFLMATAIQGLEAVETRDLTLGMLESGEQWDLARDFPMLGDKHSTGGVGDKVSLVLAPLMAACGPPIVMLTGRGLGHTAGTADKLESIPGLELSLDRELCCKALACTGVAIGIATGGIAPADRRLYALRDRTATIGSLPLITASILSKKLATGAAAIVFDIKAGDGAFLPEHETATELGRLLVATAQSVGRKARAVVTDMSQPLGRWVGHAAEVRETFDCLEGRGPADLMEVTYALCEELSEMLGERLSRRVLEEAIASGKARERFDRWAAVQGADPKWLQDPQLPLAPEEVVLEAPRSGSLVRVANRRLGELLAGAGGGRLQPDAAIDFGVTLQVNRRIGDAVAAGEELARLYLRHRDQALIAEFRECFVIADQEVEAPALIVDRLTSP